MPGKAPRLTQIGDNRDDGGGGAIADGRPPARLRHGGDQPARTVIRIALSGTRGGVAGGDHPPGRVVIIDDGHAVRTCGARHLTVCAQHEAQRRAIWRGHTGAAQQQASGWGVHLGHATRRVDPVGGLVRAGQHILRAARGTGVVRQTGHFVVEMPARLNERRVCCRLQRPAARRVIRLPGRVEQHDGPERLCGGREGEAGAHAIRPGEVQARILAERRIHARCFQPRRGYVHLHVHVARCPAPAGAVQPARFVHAAIGPLQIERNAVQRRDQVRDLPGIGAGERLCIGLDRRECHGHGAGHVHCRQPQRIEPG